MSSELSTNQPISPPRLECDYDKSPTVLYKAIQRKAWDTIVETEFDEDDYRTWVIRKEKDGQLRWRLLPLHAAIIFRAPQKVIEDLIINFTQACLLKDDQGMLPLHLALRNEPIDFAILEELLTASPSAVLVKDRKGRTPIQAGLAAAAGKEVEAKNHRRHILSTLDLYGQIMGAAVRKQVHVSYQQQLNDKQSQLENMYQNRLREIEDGFSQKSKQLEEQVAAVCKGNDMHFSRNVDSSAEIHSFMVEQHELQERVKGLLDQASDLQRHICSRFEPLYPRTMDMLLGNTGSSTENSLQMTDEALSRITVGKDAPTEDDEDSDAILAVRGDH